MGFPEISRPSPNFSATPPHERLGVLCHHSVLPFEAAITRLCDPASQVSYHCLVAPDGTRCTLVADQHVAWHAGRSQFLGRDGCNAFLLGLSFAGDTYTDPLTDAQIASALEWLALRWQRYDWSLQRITDHRQAAPGRKNDLNPVEWTRLRAAVASRFSP